MIVMNKQTPAQTEYQKRYYTEHREERIEQARVRVQDRSPEQTAARKEYMRQYRLANLEKWNRTPEQKAKINARKREQYAARPDLQEYARTMARRWQQENPERRKSQRLKIFGLTLDQYLQMLESQNGACAICGYSDLSDPKVFPVVDHCHQTGKVRGLLCMSCNQALGKFRDSPTSLAMAILYLERNGSSGAG
jgi:hypothetical protein